MPKPPARTFCRRGDGLRGWSWLLLLRLRALARLRGRTASGAVRLPLAGLPPGATIWVALTGLAGGLSLCPAALSLWPLALLTGPLLGPALSGPRPVLLRGLALGRFRRLGVGHGGQALRDGNNCAYLLPNDQSFFQHPRASVTWQIPKTSQRRRSRSPCDFGHDFPVSGPFPR